MTIPPVFLGAPAKPFWLRSPRRPQDGAIVVSVLAASIDLVRMVAAGAGLLAVTGLLIAVAGALLARRAGWAGLLLTLLGTAAALGSGWNPIVEYSIVTFTVFGVTVRGFPAVAGVVVGAAGLAAMFSVVALVPGGPVLPTEGITAVTAVLAGGAIGAALHLQRQYAESLEQRAEDAVLHGEVEAERRAAEERLRIGRDLHDIIGHNVAVISMHLGAAEVSVGRDPAVLQRSLDAARAAVQAVLVETQQTLQLLRGTERDGAPDEESLRPTPNLDALPQLLTSFEEIGLRVEGEVPATPTDVAVDPGVGLIVYRVVQEALTNAHRYGTGTVEVLVAVEAGGIRVRVLNAVPRDSAVRSGTGSGYGLLGMAERVASVGGTIDVQHDEQRFGVLVDLPIERRSVR